MRTQTFVTHMPDKPGAFMLAVKVISKRGGNIIRVSFNKAVDFHTLFVEVRAEDDALDRIAKELSLLGYLTNELSESKVIVVNIRMDDRPGTLYPVLKILDRYDINISYINSNEHNGEYQNFKMGLLIEDPQIIKNVLDDISELYPIDIIDYNEHETNLDNTIFYIRMGNEIQRMFSLSNERTMDFIRESNRILQMLQDRGEDPDKVFRHVLHLARFIAEHRNDNFDAEISVRDITPNTRLHIIEPPCGSNTYILENGNGLMFIDTGFAIYAEEMMRIIRSLFPDLDQRKKTILITHADVDHCGLLSVINDADIMINRKSAEGLMRQYNRVADHREETGFHFGYSRLSMIFSNYVPPDPSRFRIIGKDVPEEHEDMIKIDTIRFGDISFDVYEGSGGHLRGETVFFSEEPRILFTGDVYINVNGLTGRRAEFVALAPYLMTSVNVNSARAKNMRDALKGLLDKSDKECLVCSGHGSVEVLGPKK
ncbi:MAG: MBL fold metallo-hydrolase [Methanomassiliicoccaceae archaeon]|jgi:glyoxylase-like metal-dependent hydrolase (beta-lactamase superfamily II)/ACT domain-containing protein|nr:MBL fold metallo-hydrolase [Methanomassiliicoccaceae archaeon]